MSDVSQYDYELPRELISQQPLVQRTDARLLLVDRAAGSLAHWHIRDLPEQLKAGDCLVVNDTRVVPARLVGRRALTGGAWEGLFLSEESNGSWRLLAKSRGKPHKDQPPLPAPPPLPASEPRPVIVPGSPRRAVRSRQGLLVALRDTLLLPWFHTRP